MTESQKSLKEFVARINNIMMKGNFSGDDVHEASYLMSFCVKLYNEFVELENKEEEEKDGERKE